MRRPQTRPTGRAISREELGELVREAIREELGPVLQSLKERVDDAAADDFMSVSQVARTVGGAPRTVYRWIHTGKLPARRRQDGRLTVKRADVLRFMGDAG